jgi:hypothetical protein
MALELHPFRDANIFNKLAHFTVTGAKVRAALPSGLTFD